MNLVDSVRAAFTDEIILKSAIILKEKNQNIEKSLSLGIPMVLLAFLSRIEQGNFHFLLKESREKFHIGNDFSLQLMREMEIETTNPNKGIVGKYGKLLKSLFGENLHRVLDSIAGFSGTKSITAHHLLATIVPVSISELSNHFFHGVEWDISAFLMKQKESIFSRVPRGLHLNIIFNNPDLHHLKNIFYRKHPNTEDEKVDKFQEKRIIPNPNQKDGWKTILLWVIIISVIWWLVQRLLF